MVDLATAAATASQLKSILKLLPEGEKGRPKFGTCVNPERESNCPYIEVFMASVGRTGTEYRRGRFSPSDTPLDCKDAFGVESEWGSVGQEDVADENEYVLSKDLLSQPLSTLSVDCKLNLHFVNRSHIATSAVNSAASSVKDTASSIGRAVSPTNWFRTSTGEEESKEKLDDIVKSQL